MKLGVVVLLSLVACGKPETPSAPGNVVELSVTSKGFEPDRVRVKGGETVKLVVTRKTEETCATEIVLKDYGVHEKLPLGTPVTISFVPKKTGELVYGCAMDQMVKGALLVE